MSEQRLDTLEEKLAYLEANNAEMSEEIFKQQQEIAALTKAHHQLNTRLQHLDDAEADAANTTGAVSMEKPPHY